MKNLLLDRNRGTLVPGDRASMDKGEKRQKNDNRLAFPNITSKEKTLFKKQTRLLTMMFTMLEAL